MIDYLLSTQYVLYCILYTISIIVILIIAQKITGIDFCSRLLQQAINILELLQKLLEDKEDK